MISDGRHLVLIAIFIAVSTVTFSFEGSSPVFAAGTNTDREARRLFRQGVKAFEASRINDALAAFKKAYSLRPSYRILYNIAQAEAELGSPHRAIEAFEGYLADGGAKISPRRKTQVLGELARLRLLVGEVVVFGPEGAEVWVDGERKGYLPLAGPIIIPGGTHRLVVRRGRERPCEQEIVVRGGQRSEETCRPPSAELEMAGVEGMEDDGELISEGEDEATDRSTTKKDGSWFLNDVAPWVATGIGGASLIAAMICAFKTSALNSELGGACTNGVCPPNRRDDVNTLPKLAAASDAMFVITALFSAGAATLFWAPWKKREKSSKEKRARVWSHTEGGRKKVLWVGESAPVFYF